MGSSSCGIVGKSLTFLLFSLLARAGLTPTLERLFLSKMGERGRVGRGKEETKYTDTDTERPKRKVGH